MGGDHKIEYVVDASSWIFIEDNPAQNLILAKLGELIEAGRVYCPIEAWNEVKKCARVAMAAYLNGVSNPTVHVVVHEESTMRKANRKIGNACKEMGVQHLSLWQMLQKEFPNEQWP